MDKYPVTFKAARPAGNKGECFYCQHEVGDFHHPTCVLVKKKVKVRAVIEYEIEVPAHWTREQIEFHRNLSSWCSSNMLNELEELAESKGCLCPYVKYECHDDTGSSYLKE